ncbi:hypothetical protein [Cohnella faecalis]|nr:hypothetical protein [Cohnella faecalis]
MNSEELEWSEHGAKGSLRLPADPSLFSCIAAFLLPDKKKARSIAEAMTVPSDTRIPGPVNALNEDEIDG